MWTKKLIPAQFSVRPTIRTYLARAFSAAILVATTTACFTNNSSPLVYSTGTSTGSILSGSATAAANTFVISSVQIVAPGASPSPGLTPATSIFFDTSKSTTQISTVCNTNSSAGAAACVCQFSWQEINQNNGNAVQIPRSVQTALTLVQPNVVTCTPPDVYSTEIADGTSINITVLPGSGNPNSFSITPYAYVKNSGVVAGSFQDYVGNSYQNIMRYTCYEQYLRGMAIQNKNLVATDVNGVTVNVPYASQFCVMKADGTGNSGAGCGNLPRPDYSSQASYFNFYIRQSEIGDINLSNARYVCPQVQEALSGTGGVGTQGLAYPLDSTFALAMSPTVNFPVGVDGFSSLSNGSDPVSSGSQSCYPSASAGSTPGQISTPATTSTSGFNQSCLGFAATPNTDGSCPYIRSSTGQIVYTYRLRRYVVLYPPEFDSDGAPFANNPPSIDTIYVLDRPLSSAAADPLKPYTMAGPKPCPFSYFDRASVAAATATDPVTGLNYVGNVVSNGTTLVPQYPAGDGFVPGYFGTNNTNWDGKNVDGIQFPYWDGIKNGLQGCSAAMPLLNADKSVLSLGTVNASFQRDVSLRHLFIRPVLSWTPHYIEDTAFQACAPPSSNFRDPPLHFMKDTKGNVSYCAEVYPTQNPNIASLDNRVTPTAQFAGDVRNYTSHGRKGTLASPNAGTGPVCTFTPINTITAATYPPAGMANHPATFSGVANAIDKDNSVLDAAPGNPILATHTCDRTVINSGLTWGKFPLLANAPDTEGALAGDSTYNCTVTWDNSSGKSGKITPTGGCCGTNVLVKTGVGTEPKAAHLEPDAACLIPAY